MKDCILLRSEDSYYSFNLQSLTIEGTRDGNFQIGGG